MRILMELIGVAAMVFFAVAFGPARPEVPEELRAPANEEVILQAHATGVQIYVCRAESAEKSAWVLKAPDAELSDASGKQVIHHFAGPSWKHVDGSLVVGKVMAKKDAPKSEAIPWLLLSVSNHTGDGVLAQVTSIQRIHTEGGLAPKSSDCTVATNGREFRSAYAADYYFYALAKQ
jgi:hypothetical protein